MDYRDWVYNTELEYSGLTVSRNGVNKSYEFTFDNEPGSLVVDL